MSNVTQNMDDFWPCVMYVTQDRKMFSTVKSRFMHTLQHVVIVFFFINGVSQENLQPVSTKVIKF